jgi:hypothetical protein
MFRSVKSGTTYNAQRVRTSISTLLEAPADVVWEVMHKTQSLCYVAKPLLCFQEVFLNDGQAVAGLCASKE